MQRFLAFIYALILLTVSQSPAIGQVFNYTQIKDYNTDNTANVTAGNALQVDISSSSGTANVNVMQVGGASTATGNGIAGAGGVQRVTLASDSTGHVIFWDGVNTASVSAAGALKVDGSAVTQPISVASLPLPTGAATSAKQPALGTAGSASVDVLTVQGKSGMTALAVDGSAVIQPVSASSLPLPSGAATAVKQPAPGTAGSASADVISVQGIASMTALKVDGSSVTQPVSGTITANAGSGTMAVSEANLDLTQGSTTSGQKGPLMQGAVTTAAPTYTTAQTSPLSLDAAGNLRVNVVTGGAGGGAVTQSGTWANQILDSGGTNKASVSAGGALKVDSSAVTQPITQTAAAIPALVTLQNAATGFGNGTAMTTTGYATAYLNVTGTFSSGSVAFEVSGDGGTTWVAIVGITPLGGDAGTTNIGASGTQGARDYVFNVSGSSQIRARTIGVGSGTATVKGWVSPFPAPGVFLMGPVSLATSSNIIGTVLLSGTQLVNVSQINGVTPLMGNGITGTGSQRVTIASDNTAFAVNATLQTGSAQIGHLEANQTVNVSQFGGATLTAANPLPNQLSQGNAVLSQTNGLPVMPVLSTKATYIATNTAFTIAATPTDIITLVGSGTKKVKVLSCIVTAFMNGAANSQQELRLVKRSTADTGGTSATVTAVPCDSGDSAATAVVSQYTANPTGLGTLVGVIAGGKYVSQGANTVASITPFALFSLQLVGRPIVLNNASEILAINLNATLAQATQVVCVQWVWTEE